MCDHINKNRNHISKKNGKNAISFEDKIHINKSNKANQTNRKMKTKKY